MGKRAMGMPNQGEFETAELPVVLRLKLQNARPSAPASRVVRRNLGGWSMRSDRLIALSASPLIALLVYICWQWTATPAATIPSADLSAGRTMIAVPGEPTDAENEPVILPTHLDSSGPTMTPVSAPHGDTLEPEILPVMPDVDPNVHPSRHDVDENAEGVRRAECWQEGCRLGGAQAIDPSVVRIQSVQSIRPSADREMYHGEAPYSRTQHRSIPAPAMAREYEE